MLSLVRDVNVEANNYFPISDSYVTSTHHNIIIICCPTSLKVLIFVSTDTKKNRRTDRVITLPLVHAQAHARSNNPGYNTSSGITYVECLIITLTACISTNILQVALQGRENPLPNADPLLDRNTLQQEVEQELQTQFDVRLLF